MAPPRTLRVVIVDDEPAVARLHTRLIDARPDCDVVATASTGPDAVEAITRTRPDVVLLDIHLPGFSGLQVLREVRALRASQPEFIAVTAARDFASVREARLMGVRHYLVKPFSVGELRERVDDVVSDLVEEGEVELDQSAIDALLAHRSSPAPPVERLPKGLSPETLEAVRIALAAAPWSSSTEIGTAAGISRVSARRYLEHLVDTGAATRRLDYATAGRPGARYALA